MYAYLSNWINLDKNKKISFDKTSVLKDLERANISALKTRTEERRIKELNGGKSALDMTSRGVVGGVMGRGFWNRKQRLDSDPAWKLRLMYGQLHPNCYKQLNTWILGQ